MRIGIFNEPYSTAIGGSEFTCAVLAESLSSRHEVDFIHQKPSLDKDQLERLFRGSLEKVKIRKVALREKPFIPSGGGWTHYVRERKWGSELSKPYDLFINVTHGIPPFCHAGSGVLYVLFPFDVVPWSTGSAVYGSNWQGRARRAFHRWKWRRRMRTYPVKLAISDYTRAWTSRNWEIDCRTIYPPVDTKFGGASKENLLLSVGRFTLQKKQAEMMSSFRELKAHWAILWQYASVGGLSREPEHLTYCDSVRDLASQCGAEVMVNVDRRDLAALLNRASIFWHAAGFGEDETRNPWAVEHFGITTVEAMAAGCVPVVINKGGQKEIIEHGVSGFLWDSLDELQCYTRCLIGDESLRARMSEAARKRANVFSRETFVRNFLSLLPRSIGDRIEMPSLTATNRNDFVAAGLLQVTDIIKKRP